MTLPLELWTERDLAAHVAHVAKIGGWRRYHRSAHGFPDEVLVHPRRGVLLFRELKSADGRVKPEQVDWLTALRAAGADADVWRPADVDAIDELLAGSRRMSA